MKRISRTAILLLIIGCCISVTAMGDSKPSKTADRDNMSRLAAEAADLSKEAGKLDATASRVLSKAALRLSEKASLISEKIGENAEETRRLFHELSGAAETLLEKAGLLSKETARLTEKPERQTSENLCRKARAVSKLALDYAESHP